MAVMGLQFEWVSERMHDFGQILGTLYVGFEDRVLKLLSDFEAASGVGNKGGAPQSKIDTKSQVPREVRNLISHVNYKGGECEGQLLLVGGLCRCPNEFKHCYMEC